jgi:hypothetical protein
MEGITTLSAMPAQMGQNRLETSTNGRFRVRERARPTGDTRELQAARSPHACV